MYKQYYEHGSPVHRDIHNFVLSVYDNNLQSIPNRIQYDIIMAYTEIFSSVWFCNLSVMIIPCF